MASPRSAVVVSSNPEHRRSLAGLLSGCGVAALQADSLRQTKTLLNEQPVSLVLCDESLPDGGFRDVIRELARAPRKVPVIVTSCLADWNHYLKMLGAGAFDCVTSPPHAGEVQIVVGNALSVMAWRGGKA